MATPNDTVSEALSLALSERSSGLVDLVSISTPLLDRMRRNGQFSAYSGPTIRERIEYARSGTYTRYTGWEFLNIKPSEQITEAEWLPKMAAVTVALSGRDILDNRGRNQLMNIMTQRIDSAEKELEEEFYKDLHSDGTADGGRQITGLRAAIPIVNDVGIYAGIDRAKWPMWRTGSYDISDGDIPGVSSVADMDKVYKYVLSQHVLGRKGPDMILASGDHYAAFEETLLPIQRIQGSGTATAGFTGLKVAIAGRTIDVFLEGGIGSAMPTGTSYVLDSSALSYRYNAGRNFEPFGGRKAPLNQDGVIQHLGFMGELTMKNPRGIAVITT